MTSSTPPTPYTIIFSLILSSFSFLYYLTIPLTDDVRVFLSAAMNADTFGVDAAWEVKTIGNKILYYGLWKLFGWTPEESFILVMKLFVGIAVIGICWYFSQKMKDNNPWLVFCIASVSVFLIHPFCIFQCEWFAVIGAMLALALLLDKKYIPAGVILACIGFLKLSTFVFIIPVICAWILIAGKQSKWDVIRVIETFCFSIVAILVLCLLFFPHAIPDMFLSIDLVHANQIRQADFITTLASSILSTPVGIIPALATVVVSLVLAAMIQKRHGGYLLGIIMWGSCFASALAAQEFFGYHYAVLVFTAIVTLLLIQEEVVMFSLVCGIIITAVSIIPLFGALDGYMGFLSTANKDAQNIRGIVGGEKELLYLDYGEAPFYLRVPNACRYTYPLPIQRNLEGPAANEVIKCVEDYKGEYVVTQPWLESMTINKTISDYLSKCDWVYNGTWQVCRRTV